jgi:Putative NADP-dependent oxidoreductases
MSETPAGVAREVRLVATPEGLPEAGHLAVVEAPIPVPKPGEVLVRNRWFQVFPSLRTVIAGGVPGAPFPPLHPGDTLFGPAVGEVVAAAEGEDGGPRPGDLVFHYQGWREYAVVPVSAPPANALPDPAAYLAPGATAYAALTAVAGLRPGETVFVTGGSGAVGSLAGQIARRLGAGRVVGSTGSAAKAGRMVAEFGYDATVPRDATLRERLAEAAPDGVDVVVDNVGGEQLQAAVAAARPGARIVLIGTLAAQLSAASSGTTAPVELDTFQLIVKDITVRGLLSVDERTGAEWVERFGGWLRSGEITFPHTRIAGIDRAPEALQGLLSGRYVGTVVVEL